MQMSMLSRYNDALIDAVLTFYIHFSSSPLSKGGTQSTKLRSNFDERVCEMKRVKRRWTLKSGGNSTMDTPLWRVYRHFFSFLPSREQVSSLSRFSFAYNVWRMSQSRREKREVRRENREVRRENREVRRENREVRSFERGARVT